MAIKKSIDLVFDNYDYLKIDSHNVVVQPDINSITVYLKVCKDRDHNSSPAASIGYNVPLDTFTELLIKYYSKDDINSYITCLYMALATLEEFTAPDAEPILEPGQILL